MYKLFLTALVSVFTATVVHASGHWNVVTVSTPSDPVNSGASGSLWVLEPEPAEVSSYGEYDWSATGSASADGGVTLTAEATQSHNGDHTALGLLNTGGAVDTGTHQVDNTFHQQVGLGSIPPWTMEGVCGCYHDAPSNANLVLKAVVECTLNVSGDPADGHLFTSGSVSVNGCEVRAKVTGAGAQAKVKLKATFTVKEGLVTGISVETGGELLKEIATTAAIDILALIETSLAGSTFKQDVERESDDYIHVHTTPGDAVPGAFMIMTSAATADVSLSNYGKTVSISLEATPTQWAFGFAGTDGGTYATACDGDCPPGTDCCNPHGDHPFSDYTP